MGRKKKSSWDKNAAIEDLLKIKEKSIDAMCEEKTDTKSGETKMSVDQKAATTAINCIKELNAICGVSKDNENECNKVVINDDI